MSAALGVKYKRKPHNAAIVSLWASASYEGARFVRTCGRENEGVNARCQLAGVGLITADGVIVCNPNDIKDIYVPVRPVRSKVVPGGCRWDRNPEVVGYGNDVEDV
jgi:hypothetical protein